MKQKKNKYKNSKKKKKKKKITQIHNTTLNLQVRSIIFL